MTHTNPEWLEHQLRRWMRPDAHRFVRPDWRRHVRPGFERDHPFALYEQKYRPDQPRVPAGNPDGGEWTADTSGHGLAAASNAVVGNGAAKVGSGINKNNDKPHINNNKTPLPHISAEAAAAFAADGHHHFPRQVSKGYPTLSDEARAVFKQAKTGPLLDPTSNFFDHMHREYNVAVKELFDRYLETKKIDPAKMTGDQAREFLGELFISDDPRIRNFRWRMIRREMRRYMGRSRGFE